MDAHAAQSEAAPYVHHFDFTADGQSLRLFRGDSTPFSDGVWSNRQRVHVDTESMSLRRVDAGSLANSKQWVGAWTRLQVARDINHVPNVAELPRPLQDDVLVFANSDHRNPASRALVSPAAAAANALPHLKCGLGLECQISEVPYSADTGKRINLCAHGSIAVAAFSCDGSTLFTVPQADGMHQLHQWRVQKIAAPPNTFSDPWHAGYADGAALRIQEVRTSIVFGSEVDAIRF